MIPIALSDRRFGVLALQPSRRAKDLTNRNCTQHHAWRCLVGAGVAVAMAVTPQVHPIAASPIP